MNSEGKLNCQGKRALIFNDSGKKKNTDELALEAAQVINARFKELIQFQMVNLMIAHQTECQKVNKLADVVRAAQQAVQNSQKVLQESKNNIQQFDANYEKVLEGDMIQLSKDAQLLSEIHHEKENLLALLAEREQLVQLNREMKKKSENLHHELQDFVHKKDDQIVLIKKLQEQKEQERQRQLMIQNEVKQLIQTQRVLNNELQEAKGNIRVYCRIRPLLNDQLNQEQCIQTTGECSIQLSVPKNYHKSDNFNKTYNFNFEHIFDQNAEQNQVYAELSQLIENVIDGHNVCIFAYGQTGSGKTFTMQGEDNQEKRGVIPRAVEHMFAEIKNLKDLGWTFKMKIGFQEIYNETIKDLLTNRQTEEIQMSEVADQPQVQELFRKAMENRKVAETQCNEFSSRSHFVFQLNLQGQSNNPNEKKINSINSTLNLIDLAGSERLNLVKTEGDRLKETQCINKSLTALSDVINALAQKSAFVPYRNSKLTFILQRYLEGSSKTLMMVNISPKLDDFNQTMQSLRFAEKVKSCKSGAQDNKSGQIVKK